MGWMEWTALAFVGTIIVVFLFHTLKDQRMEIPRTSSAVKRQSGETWDELSSLWIRGLAAEGLERVHQLLSRPQADADRIILYRWMARFSGFERNLHRLDHALEASTWINMAAEASVWKVWQDYLSAGESRKDVTDLLLKSFDEHGDRVGVPALRILIFWLVDTGRSVEAWRVWSDLPESFRSILSRRIDPVEDLIRWTAPDAFDYQAWKDLKSMIGWLGKHRPHEPLRAWLMFQRARSFQEPRPEQYLFQGLSARDHYWLYRTLESWCLEKGDPPAIQQVYIRNLQTHKSDPRSLVLMLLHDLRVERLRSAEDHLDKLAGVLSDWPPYWLWYGYTVSHLGRNEEATMAWKTYWELVRHACRIDIHPFCCDVCRYGCPRWWDQCPACGRLGTLDLVVPKPIETSRSSARKRPMALALDNLFE